MRLAHDLTVSKLAAATAITVCLTAPAFADALLSGTIKSASGEAVGGVTVSAKADGATITTTVFTDESGRYYFPPLPNGHYRVWAQGLSGRLRPRRVQLISPPTPIRISPWPR